MTPPVPDCLSPWRWRWILLTTRHRKMRFLYWPPPHPTGHRNLQMFDRDGYDIGQLVWMVRDACRVGSINKISISPALEKKPGVAFPQYGGVCEHLTQPRGYRPPLPGSRPRPVLERTI
ncbi:hypothetical protein CTZ27_25610 [Streptomyces griseocarneus]|nr:hypothetical protein CTZ27_25610 [Streptomyces griseocarneus]